MIKRNNSIINKFVIVLSVIIFIEIINFVMNLYVNVNDIGAYNVVDIIYIVKFVAIVALFIPLFRWTQDKDNELLKDQLIVHTKYVFVISIFYFLIIYLYKYSIVLDVMDILRNKMIEGNPALLLNFAVHAFNEMKYVKGAFQSFNSEMVLLVELLFITWHLRNVMTLDTVDEEEVHYDSFLYNKNLKYFSLALVVTSFLSINLFKFVFDTPEALMFFVSFFLFTVSVPLHYFVYKIGDAQRKKSTKSSFEVFHKLTLILSVISIIGFVINLGLNLYTRNLGIGTYRIFSTVTALGLSIYITYRIQKSRNLLN